MAIMIEDTKDYVWLRVTRKEFDKIPKEKKVWLVQMKARLVGEIFEALKKRDFQLKETWISSIFIFYSII